MTPPHLYGIPAAVIRWKARQERERERREEQRLRGALDALVENQRRLAAIVDVARGEGQPGALQ